MSSTKKAPTVSTINTVLSRTSNISPTAGKLDPNSEIAVKTICAVINRPNQPSISAHQARTSRDRPTRGPVWASRVTFETFEEADARRVLLKSVKSLHNGGGYAIAVPALHKVTGDSGSPASSRSTAARLATRTGGRCFSVGYRLSPKYPFPTSLFHLLVAYLSLLYPPPESLHEAVPASSIVIAADSAGGNLSLSLIQLILQIHRQTPSSQPHLQFQGKEIDIPLPAGVSAISAYGDLTHAMPSWKGNQNYGQEMLVDEGKVIAQRAARQGVTVVFDEYGAMPHNFPTLPVLGRLPQSERCFRKWAEFCVACVREPASLRSSATFVEARPMREKALDVDKLIDLPFEEVKRMMGEAVEKQREKFEKVLSLKVKASL
ncbi:hypothetical protein MMC25_006956 [Agyrium rufum]|nr:hypothetical protein [Agyrium rufum]